MIHFRIKNPFIDLWTFTMILHVKSLDFDIFYRYKFPNVHYNYVCVHNRRGDYMKKEKYLNVRKRLFYLTQESAVHYHSSWF